MKRERCTNLFSVASALAIGGLLLLSISSSADAQTRGGGRRGGSGSDQSQSPDSSKPAPPPPAPVEKGPFLERGAVLCSSREELLKYQTASTSGATAPDPAPDCQTILSRVVVRILNRDGPSRTQVMTQDEAGQTGWTNVYYPPSE